MNEAQGEHTDPFTVRWSSKVSFVARLHYRSIATVTAFVIVLDQMVKGRMVVWLGPQAVEHRRELAGRFLAFEYVENTGAAFGILAGRVWLVSALAIAVVALFILLTASQLPANALNRIASGMILGGAAGNMIDRIRLGYVIDYISVGAWPKFNVADTAVTLGVALVAIGTLRDDQPVNEPGDPVPDSTGVLPSTETWDHHERNDVAR